MHDGVKVIFNVRNQGILAFTRYEFWLLTGQILSSKKFLFTFCFCYFYRKFVKPCGLLRVNLNVNISVKRLVHDGVKVIFNVRKQRERHSFSEAGARYKKNHDFLRSSWWFSAFVKRGRPYKTSAIVKFIYSEKTTKFGEIFPLLLSSQK